MNAEIIEVGTDLLSGQMVDTNSTRIVNLSEFRTRGVAARQLS